MSAALLVERRHAPVVVDTDRRTILNPLRGEFLVTVCYTHDGMRHVCEQSFRLSAQLIDFSTSADTPVESADSRARMLARRMCPADATSARYVCKEVTSKQRKPDVMLFQLGRLMGEGEVSPDMPTLAPHAVDTVETLHLVMVDCYADRERRTYEQTFYAPEAEEADILRRAIELGRQMTSAAGATDFGANYTCMEVRDNPQRKGGLVLLTFGVMLGSGKFE